MKRRHKGYFNEGRKIKNRHTVFNLKLYGTHQEYIYWQKIMRYGRNMSKTKTKVRSRLINKLNREYYLG